MKKFFKALAVVLALTLVIGTIPASAAVSLELKGDGKKIIYIDGSKGTKADGTKCAVVNKYKLSKLVKNFDADTMDIKLSSADKSIATTSNNYDRVYAKGIGTTEVTITVLDLESENQDKILATLVETVQVKKNATKDSFVVISDEIVDGAKVGVNTEYTVKMPRVQNGVKVDTDKRELVADSDAVVIEKANKAGTVFTVKFTAPGEYTLTARAFQSDLFPGTTQSQEIKVTAGFEAESVKQVALNKAEVTFDSNVSGLSKDNFSAYYMINDVEVPFSSVKEVVCAENTATVEFYTPFTQDVEFFVKYDNKTVGSFKSIKLTASSVAAVIIPNQEVYSGQLTDIKFTLVDENGIDITSIKDDTSIGGYMQFSLVEAPTDAFATDSQVYIAKAGTSYQIIGKYNWLVDGNPKNVEGTGLITAVEQPKEELASYVGILTTETDDVKGDVSKAVKVLALNDTNVNVQVNFKYINTDNKDRNLMSDTYQLVVADESVVMLGAANGAGYKLIPNKEGSTTILIYSPADSNNNRTVLGVVPVTVKAKRAATSFEVKADKLNLNIGYAADKVVFTYSVLDQYGDKVPNTAVTVSQVAATEKFAKIKTDAVIDVNAEKGEVTLEATDLEWTADGAVTLEFKYNDSLKSPVAISVTNKAEASAYKLELSGTSLDTSVKNDTTAKSIKVSLAGITSNGYAAPGVNDADLEFVAEAPKSSAVSGSGTSYVYTVTRDGNKVERTDNFVGNEFTSVVSGAAGTATSGSAVKLTAGNYIVTAYKKVADETKTVVTVIGTASFTVSDNQVAPTVKMEKETIAKVDVENKAAVVAELNKAFTFKFSFLNDNTAAADFEFQANADGSKVYVKTATVILVNSSVGNVKFELPIGALVDMK